MIVAGICTAGLLASQRGENLPTHAYRIALFTEAADLSPKTRAYSKAGESSGKGYMPGGIALEGLRFLETVGERVAMAWADARWPLSSVVARGALIYNGTTGTALRVIDFGASLRSEDADFLVELPPEGALVLTVER